MRLIKWLALALLASGTPLMAAWHQASTAHFVIYSEQDPATLQAFAERLERFDRALRVARGFGDPPLTDAARLTVYVVRDNYAVSRLAGSASGNILGFYVPRLSRPVTYVPAKTLDAKLIGISRDNVFFHEYTHHLLYQNWSVALPAWLVEGLAEFHAETIFGDDGSIGFGGIAQHRAYGLFEFAGLPFSQMLGGTYRSLDYRQTELLYGRGWLLTHYLMFEPARGGQLDRYIQLIQAGQTPLDSARAAFGDLETLERELGRYMRRKKFNYYSVKPQKIVIGPVKIRPLLPAESAMIEIRMKADAGVARSAARAFAADARKAAAPYPRDALAQLTLARAEFAANDLAASEAAVDRALVTDPNNGPALTMKGQLQMHRTSAVRKRGDWKTIRSWFAKANRRDPEDAEPLYAFYQSFRLAGERPTANATKGLRYAQTLAPYNEAVRMQVAYSYLLDGNSAEAIRALSFLAVRPHGSKTRQDAQKLVELLKAGQKDEALKLMTPKPDDEDEEQKD